jgi:magnesium-transporting ATPase (P-type)
MHGIKTTVARAASAISKAPVAVPHRALSTVPTQVRSLILYDYSLFEFPLPATILLFLFVFFDILLCLCVSVSRVRMASVLPLHLFYGEVEFSRPRFTSVLSVYLTTCSILFYSYSLSSYDHRK